MKNRRLDPEEARLWRLAVKDVAPLAPSKNPTKSLSAEPHGSSALSGHSSAESPLAGDQGTAPASARHLTGGAREPLKTPPKLRAKRPRKSAAGLPAALGAGDPGFDKRVARGRLTIDRVLDLHGLTQAAARPRLETFLRAAHKDGCRCVLVITGKGGPASASNMARARSRRDEDYQQADNRRSPRGVLREQTPAWIDGSSLRGLVARVAPARPKDGGDGAYYVFLKS